MRKLILLAVMAAAAMAFSSPSAFAAVEVEDRASSTMCDDTTAGFCEADLVASLATTQVHTVFGEVNYVCDVSIPVHVQSSGALSSESVSFVDAFGGTGNCADLSPCEEPWTGTVSEAGGSEALDFDICVDYNGLTQCEGDLHMSLTDTGTAYTAELNDVDLECETACEFSGHYAMDVIEIHHP